MTAARQPRGEGKPETEGTETAVGEGSRPTATQELESTNCHRQRHIYQRSRPVKRQVDSCDRDRDETTDSSQYSLKIPPSTTQDLQYQIYMIEIERKDRD